MCCSMPPTYILNTGLLIAVRSGYYMKGMHSLWPLQLWSGIYYHKVKVDFYVLCKVFIFFNKIDKFFH